MINMELQPTYSGYAQPQSNLHQPTTPPRHQPLKLHFDDTLCPICKFRTETPMQIHYGGQACFSCRAFFRRAHQKTKAPQFVCKRMNSCEITVKTRRRCQKCRYDLCLKIGMKPEAVLTEDQRKVRFRNAIKKKEARNTQNISREFIDEEEEEEENANDFDISDIQDQDEDNRQLNLHPNNEDERMKDESSPKNNIRVQSDQYDNEDLETDDVHPESPTNLEYQPEWKRLKTEYDDCVEYERRRRQENNYYQEEYFLEDPQNKSHTSSSSAMEENEIKIEPKIEPFEEEESTEPHGSSDNSNEYLYQDDDDDDGDECLPPFSFIMTKAGDPPSVFGDKQVKKLQKCFDITLAQMTPQNAFMRELLDYHRGEYVLSKSSLLDHVVILGKQFKHFALLHKEFLDLPKGDKRKLLARNTPLYVQYILGRYISADFGRDQFNWLFGPDTLQENEKIGLHKISLKKLNQHLNLFHIGAEMDEYKDCANRLKHPEISYQHLAIIAHFLVFQYDKGMHLDSEENIANYLQHAYKMGPHIQHNFGGLKTLSFIYIENLFSTLNSMARFFAQHVVWKDFEHPSDNSSNMPHSPSSSDGGSPTSTDLIPRYSAEEENWFNMQITNFEKAWKSVPLGEEHIRDFIMFSFDVPVSNSYMHNAISVFNERVLRVLKIHSEFAKLPDSLQTTLIERNRMYASALQCAVCENSETGYEQLVFTYGESDKEVMSKEFAYVSPKQIKKMTMTNVNKCNNFLADPLLKSFNTLVQNIGTVVKSESMFKLLTLVMLFSDIKSSESLEMNLVYKQYLNVMNRRQAALMGGDRENQLAFGRNIYSKFSACMSDVKKLATVLQQMHSAPSSRN